ncbi:ATP-binding cassette domain-containing protein [Lysinibacillus sp. NPDC093190]
MGYCYLLLSQNGAGKSTLSKCIAKDVKPDGCSIVFNDSS